MSDVSLKPCPWCGPLPKIEEPVDATRILGVWNLIHRCKTFGPIKIEASTRAGVVKRWNARKGGGHE